MNLADGFTVVATLVGCFFFMAGTLGLIRFPDVTSRLHALAKTDNLGLGFIALGVMPQLTPWLESLQVFVTWVLVMISGAVASFLIANYSLMGRPLADSQPRGVESSEEQHCE